MAITVGNASVIAGLDQKTLSHNNNGDFLVVGLTYGYTDSQTATAVTYAGAAMTKAIELWDGIGGVQWWYRVAPAAGSNNVVATWSNSNNTALMATSFSGVHQSTPIGTAVGAEDPVGSTAVTVTATSASGELVVDVMCGRRSHSDITASIGAGQTQSTSGISGSGSTHCTGHMSTEDGAASVVMSWTLSGTGRWHTAAVPLKPAAAAGAKAPLWILNPGY